MKTQFNKLNFIIIVLSIGLLSGCSSSTGGSKVDVTPPPVPSGLTITEIGNGAVSLSWKSVSDKGLKGYSVFWMSGAEIDTLQANHRFVTINSITISGLDYDTEYSFAVSSIDKSDNESALSVKESGTPYNTTSPAHPSGVDLVAVNIDSSLITVYWNKNEESDFEYYRLHRALTAAGLEDSTSFITTLTEEIYVDTDVEVGMNYYYRLTAVDKGGRESAPSEIVNDYVLPEVILISPVGRETAGTSPTFKWENVQGAKKYNFVLFTSSIGGEIWNTTVMANDNPDETIIQTTYNGKTRLIVGNTYYWVVGAISRKEINSKSNVEAFRVQ